jgi:secreted trypsin-like serine protease
MSRGSRIINGTIVSSANKYPWFCQVVSNMKCGGSYIGNSCVLTAAHCFFNDDDKFVNNPDEWKIIMGSLDRNTGGKIYQVTSITPHPKYNEGVPTNNDLCILKLSRDPALDGFSPVPLITKELKNTLEVIGNTTTVMGFGNTTDGGNLSPNLLEADVKIASIGNNNGTSYEPGQITENMLTAGNINPDRDSCQGDSGGPLVALNSRDGKIYQLGIVSFGGNCGDPQFPGVYTMVSQYLNWIDGICGTVKINEVCCKIRKFLSAANSSKKHGCKSVKYVSRSEKYLKCAIKILKKEYKITHEEKYKNPLQKLKKAYHSIKKHRYIKSSSIQNVKDASTILGCGNNNVV